ncbi:conserved hypothetical protein [Pediculus humanus corporis]|uniref:Uncharacterized protein n=1 Tax=Pediculus humanus subsp. corporis TaxID=121224 RepID=E0VDH4_PEDHC|nr:uncharacterized protein Phum_PHUM116540 [Pediculus humanus corporis]EEB11430.1 conserved hypothetical protein [Pediculus humanus corporis]
MLNNDFIENAKKYKKEFSEYSKNNIMYKKRENLKPWELVEKVSDIIIFDIIKEIASEFQNENILKRLYVNELLEITN